MKKDIPPQRKSLIFYYVIVIVVMIIFNSLLLPSIQRSRIIEVSYSDFLDMLEGGAVQQVQVEDASLTYLAEVNGQQMMFTTGRIEDDNKLTERLDRAGAVFAKEIPQESSLLMEIILSYVLPMVMFVIIGQLLMRMMTKRMSG